jgi:hypothetical protein
LVPLFEPPFPPDLSKPARFSAQNRCFKSPNFRTQGAKRNRSRSPCGKRPPRRAAFTSHNWPLWFVVMMREIAEGRRYGARQSTDVSRESDKGHYYISVSMTRAPGSSSAKETKNKNTVPRSRHRIITINSSVTPVVTPTPIQAAETIRSFRSSRRRAILFLRRWPRGNHELAHDNARPG